MSLLREVKPRNARTARIVKAREPQLVESRKQVLVLHGTRCPDPVRLVLKTIASLTKPHSVVLNKKNENIHPFEKTESLEFLALKNDCGLVVFGTSSKKRPNNITVVRIFDGKVLDMAELLLLTSPEEKQLLQDFKIGVEMKPMILFAGSQWTDTSSSDTATTYQTLRSLLLDLFQGEEIPSVDVAGLQFVLMIATGEQDSSMSEDDVANRPVIHLRWYKVKTIRSTSPKIPRVELEPVGPAFDFRVGRVREADALVMKEAMKHGRRPNEPKTKKNIDMDLVGDKIGRVHLGKQDLSQLQTRKMKGLKRGRDEVDGDEAAFSGDDSGDEEMISQDDEGSSLPVRILPPLIARPRASIPSKMGSLSNHLEPLLQALEPARAAIETVILEPSLHPLLEIVKAARNGAVYGAKVRFPHALVMVFLFRSGTLREKIRLVLKATRAHASNLARFAIIYKSMMLIQRILNPGNPGKEPHYSSFLSGLVGGYLVFGSGTAVNSSVSQQIVIYVFARVMLALARLSVEPAPGGAPFLPTQRIDPALRKKIQDAAWPVFASLSWAFVMYLFRWRPETVQGSLRSSMKYMYVLVLYILYVDSDTWDGLRNFLIYNT
ncbi:hypothetical protein DV735_g5517, partial [Chaetothyriales sp. CBS 134920]